ncbi:endonuclease exonuclease phosphatase domain containing protein [Plakobranchus ocellatus]|uniref:Endonuclease exonuclease phosphatase domain containing protein n=1 Tax=Plakobranchus ocellatus TaxID=259542 RepID=A0AAV4AT80_9GAST|nr:endonuclease exonuclease phosphatase domain containing protein [Plakobranchus ocellatus]
MSQNHTETLVNSVKGFCDSNSNPSFNRDSHVQQMASGRHPASARKIKTDKTSKIAMWNVRTLHQKGKLENVVKEMEMMKLNILGLAQVRWTGPGSMKLGSKTLIYSEGHTHERGVGIVFDVTTAKSLGSWCSISDRVVVAKLVAKPLNLGIIQIYAPTSDSEDVEVEKFYEEIEKTKGYLKFQDIIIVMGLNFSMHESAVYI